MDIPFCLSIHLLMDIGIVPALLITYCTGEPVFNSFKSVLWPKSQGGRIIGADSSLNVGKARGPPSC